MNKEVQKNQTSGELGMKDGKPYPPPMDVMCEDKPPDQSPITTCEWTEGRVFAYFESEDFKGLADAIKSALAAEREKGFSEAAKIYKPARDDDRREIQQLREQLAATERKYLDMERRNRESERQLAAEKEVSKEWFDKWGAEKSQRVGAERQLAAAQASIVAAAQQPLVDALILAKQSCPLASTHDVIDAAIDEGRS